MDNKPLINKDLILRENLALERTEMANDRTFLSFIRTSLYFAIAGMTLDQLIDINYGLVVKIVFYILSSILLLTGIYKFVTQRKKLINSRKHIGNYKLEWENNVTD